MFKISFLVSLASKLFFLEFIDSFPINFVLKFKGPDNKLIEFKIVIIHVFQFSVQAYVLATCLIMLINLIYKNRNSVFYVALDDAKHLREALRLYKHFKL